MTEGMIQSTNILHILNYELLNFQIFRPFAAPVEFLRCISYYPLELFVLPWNTYSGDINNYMKAFFTFPNDNSLSSIVFTIFRWYYTLAAVIWLLISLLNIRQKSKYNHLSNDSSKQDVIALTVKNPKPSKYADLLENLILISMLVLLIVMLLMCCRFEYFNPHMM